jgi:hypothetical protein
MTVQLASERYEKIVRVAVLFKKLQMEREDGAEFTVPYEGAIFIEENTP